MTVRARPAWLVQTGDVVILDGRGTVVFGARWVSGGRGRRRRLFVHDHDGKPRYDDFRPSDWLEVIDVDQ